jgi:hypothetical protein
LADQRRKSDRVKTQLPLSIEGGTGGITRDISPQGVYFILDGKQPEENQEIRFTMDFAPQPGTGTQLRMNCIGRVVRVETAEGKWGVAIAISEASLESVS